MTSMTPASSYLAALSRPRVASVVACLVLMIGLAVGQTPPTSRPAEPEPPAGAVRVACVGDSITYGQGIKDRTTNNYPARLGVLLGDGFAVRNFGVNGTTALTSGDRPYVKRPAHGKALAFKPDVLIVGLGTNDTKPQNWGKSAEFVADYKAILAAFEQAKPTVKIYVVLPPPCFLEGENSIRDAVLEKETVPMIRQIAADVGATVIDVRTPMADKRELFPDSIHPNAAGATLYAGTVAAALRAE